MITLLIIMGIVAYLATGYHFGRKDVPRHLDELAMSWKSTYDPYYWDRIFPGSDNSKERQEALKARATAAAKWPFVWAFFWPIVAIKAWVAPRLLAEGQKLDPIAQGIRIKEQQKRIADLERDLGIEEYE